MRGATLRARYATSTASNSGERLAEERVAFHWKKRAAGDVVRAPSDELIGSDQALQFFSGRSRLPLRVRIAMRPRPSASKPMAYTISCAAEKTFCWWPSG